VVTKLLVFGDWGTGPIGEDTGYLITRHAEKMMFDAVLFLGDLGYDLEDFNGRIGDIFGRISQPLTSSYPFMTIPGNHDVHANGTHYKERYNMPWNEANNGTDSFYSFDLGPAHYIMFDTEKYLVKGYDHVSVR
jgi:hypothetical protein